MRPTNLRYTRVPKPGRPGTPAQPPKIKQRPALPPPQGIAESNPTPESDRHTHRVELYAIAPAYEFVLVVIRDRFFVESRWILPADRKLGEEGLEKLILDHIHVSQVETRRN